MIIWLASYPRSGNTFFRVLLHSVFDIHTYSIYNDKFDIGADPDTSNVVGHAFLPEDFDIDSARKEDRLYIIKTHGYPPNEEDKAIYLVRDGRDSSLSYMKYRQSFEHEKKSLLDVFYGNILYGSWGQHVMEWAPRDRKNTLLIKFEELIENPVGFIDEISRFINIEPQGEKIPTFEELKKINPKFFRKGKINSWKDEFSEQEHLAFWMKNHSHMVEFGYDQDIPKSLLHQGQAELFLQLSSENSYLLRQFQNQFIKTVGQKNAQIKQLLQILEQKDMEIKAKQQLIVKRFSELKEKQQTLKQKDEKIAAQINVIKDKDNTIEDKDNTIAGLRDALAEKETLLAKQQDEVEKLKGLEESIDLMRRHGTFFLHPLGKLKAYKRVLKAHDRVKKKVSKDSNPS